MPAPQPIDETEEEMFPDVMDEQTRHRYDEACKRLEEQLDSVAKEIVESEQLTRDDFAIRINAR